MDDFTEIHKNASGVSNNTNKPIRVLCVVNQMNRAGVESRLMDIYRNLDRSIIQFDFYTCRLEEGQYDKEIFSMGGNVFYNKPLSIGEFYIIPKRFYEFMVTHPEYKIVHAHMNQWCGLILKGAKKAGVSVRIAHSRTALGTLTIKNMAKNMLKVVTNKYATHLFAVSKKAGIWLFGKNAIKNNKVQVWPNAIDCNKYLLNNEIRESVRNELQLKDEFTIIHVGNFRPEKNHKFLLEIFKEILTMEKNSSLILVGEDYSLGEYQDLTLKMGIVDKVIFLGSRNDVYRILQAGDVFVFPSIYEGLPGAVLEAQAASLPCLISDTITDEVCISPYVKRLSLSLSAKQWAEYALECSKKGKNNSYIYFERAGFDVVSLAKKLSDFYIDSINK